MKTKIEKINNTILAKGNSLKAELEREFSEINISETAAKPVLSNNKGKNPPIIYVLYGVAAISVISIFSFESITAKILSVGVAAASIYGGNKVSRSMKNNSIDESQRTQGSSKSEIVNKITSIVKNKKEDWGNFMSKNQKDIQNFITESDMDSEKKDCLFSKIYTYEIIDVPLLDISTTMNQAFHIGTTAAIINAEESYLAKVKNAIDIVVEKQINKYNSLLK